MRSNPMRFIVAQIYPRGGDDLHRGRRIRIEALPMPRFPNLRAEH